MQSHEQVPIIVVCVIVGGGLVVYVLFRLLRHRKKPTPLPPIQPLAHHREQHAKQLEVERYISYSESQASRSLLGPPSSITSSPRLSPSRPGSFFGGSASNTTEDIPNLASRTPVSNEAEPLGLPNPAFLTPSTSGPSSRSSSSFEIASEGSAPSNDDTERSVTPSSPATSMSKQKRFSTTASRSSRLRPHSTLTAPSYRSTRTSRIPHARDSQIQIVLPAPLAPEIYQNKGSAGPGVARSNSQISLADKWTPSLHRSTSTKSASIATERFSLESIHRPLPPMPYIPSTRQDTAPSAWRAGPDLERGRPASMDNPRTTRSRSGSRTRSDTNHRPIRKTRSQISQPESPIPTDN